MQCLHMKRSVLAVVAVAGLASAVDSHAGYIDLTTNREWRQLTETVDYSFNDVNTSGSDGCSASTGVCAGHLGGTGSSVAGWTWATEPDVRQLFHDFSGAAMIPGFTPLPASPSTSYYEAFSTWAPAIIDTDGAGPDPGIFVATLNNGYAYFVSGLSRTVDPGYYGARDGVYGMSIVDVYDSTVGYCPAGFGLCGWAVESGGADPDYRSPAIGLWLYRPVASIPEPETYVTLLAGLGLLGFMARRRKQIVA